MCFLLQSGRWFVEIYLGRKVMTNLDSIFKSRDITLTKKVHLVKAMVFPGWMWELDCEESWAPKNWCFWTVVLEKTLESPLECKEIQPVHSKGDQSWVFFGRNDAKADTPVLWPPHAKSWLIGKDSDAGRDWGQEEKGTTEDGMAGWHYRLDGHKFEWTLGVGDGQGDLACCSLWGRKELDTTEGLNYQLTTYVQPVPSLCWHCFLLPRELSSIQSLPTPIQALFLGQEDPLEKGKATHSSILAWRIPWTI